MATLKKGQFCNKLQSRQAQGSLDIKKFKLNWQIKPILAPCKKNLPYDDGINPIIGPDGIKI